MALGCDFLSRDMRAVRRAIRGDGAASIQRNLLASKGLEVYHHRISDLLSTFVFRWLVAIGVASVFTKGMRQDRR